MSLETLTLISTTCIVLSGLSLLVGWYFIKVRRDIGWHERMMLAATAFAGLFLVAYVSRWYLHGSKPFAGTGGWRSFYLANLLPHILLATAVGPMALRLIYLAKRKMDFTAHKRRGSIMIAA